MRTRNRFMVSIKVDMAPDEKFDEIYFVIYFIAIIIFVFQQF